MKIKEINIFEVLKIVYSHFRSRKSILSLYFLLVAYYPYKESFLTPLPSSTSFCHRPDKTSKSLAGNSDVPDIQVM